jgi:hypothetical protein
MKAFLFKTLASIALKNSIAYAYKVSILVLAALRGVLDGGNVSDQHRLTLESVLKAVTAVRDFLVKLTVLFGVSSLLLQSNAYLPALTSLNDAVERLNKTTEEL